MRVLTDDLTRLRNEILALRSARQGLIHDLERETEHRRADVSRVLTSFSKGLGAVARRAKADRSGSLADLKRTVSDLRTEVRTDLSGIRHAWLSPGTPSRNPGEEPTSRRSQEGGVHAAGTQGRRGGKRPLVPVGGEKPARKKRKH